MKVSLVSRRGEAGEREGLTAAKVMRPLRRTADGVKPGVGARTQGSGRSEGRSSFGGTEKARFGHRAVQRYTH
jgi:hypothetical protein